MSRDIRWEDWSGAAEVSREERDAKIEAACAYLDAHPESDDYYVLSGDALIAVQRVGKDTRFHHYRIVDCNIVRYGIERKA